jgi:hypothetical protein
MLKTRKLEHARPNSGRAVLLTLSHTSDQSPTVPRYPVPRYWLSTQLHYGTVPFKPELGVNTVVPSRARAFTPLILSSR